MISAAVILDSISEQGSRLTTLELVLPRFLLAQLNTHRAFSRNAASSRAIPTAKLIEQVMSDPFVPTTFARNQRGMQAGEELALGSREHSKVVWLRARDAAVEQAAALAECGVHKQWANRLLEPFLWVKVLVSATEWSNFRRLRLHDDAQPEFQELAAAMKVAMDASRQTYLSAGRWHLPYISDAETMSVDSETLRRWSVARCARLGLSTPEKDEELYERLLTGSGFGHFSPFEHIATPTENVHSPLQGNLRGWEQWRKSFANECG